MKTFNLYTLLMSLLIFIGCDNDNEGYTGPLNSILFEIIDADGNDLLDPESVNAKAIKSYSYYAMEDGEWVEHREPYRFSISKEDASLYYRLRTSAYYIPSQKETSFIIKWNETDCDTIRCEWKKNDVINPKHKYKDIVIKTFLNEVQVWPEVSTSERCIIKLIK